MDGTSASTPVFAGVLALLNSRRIENGLSSIGWATPQLYKMHTKWGDEIFNDITKGDNHCCSSNNESALMCCDQGFNASKGWDPVTGLGSVNAGKLLHYMSSYSFDVDDDYTNAFSDDGLTKREILGLEIGVPLFCVVILAILIRILILRKIVRDGDPPGPGGGSGTKAAADLAASFDRAGDNENPIMSNAADVADARVRGLTEQSQPRGRKESELAAEEDV